MLDPAEFSVRDLTIGKVLARRSVALGAKPFLNYLPYARTYSYAEVDGVTNRIANSMVRHGVGRGSHVAVMMNNCPEQLFTYFALGKVGAVAVPINTAIRGEALLHQLTLADVTDLMVDVEHLGVIERSERLPQMRSTFVLVDEPGIEMTNRPGLIDFQELLRGLDHPPPVEVKFSDLAFIMFTSGTTGPSKGVMVTQASVFLGALQNINSYGYNADDVYYVCMPLFHVNALRGSIYISLMTGGAVALSRRFSASRFWPEVMESTATTFNLLGSMVSILWAREPTDSDRKHRVRLCRAVPTPTFAAEFERRFNLRVISTYGLTDYGVPVAYTASDPSEKLGSSGRAQPGWYVRIVDEDDFDVPTGQVGEIVMRTDNLWEASSGYYKMAEATVESMRNNWFHTGDRGYLDADGYLYFVDRKKDSIRRRGENISAWEVEQVILGYPDVQDAAVFALSSEMSEDEVAVAIVLRPGATIDGPRFIAFCADRMAYFMVPRFVHFANDLPRTSSNKVEKYKLRDWAEKHRAMLWDREKEGIVVSR